MGIVRGRLRELVHVGLVGPRRRQFGGPGLLRGNRAPPGATEAWERWCGVGEGLAVRATSDGGFATRGLARRLVMC